MRRPFANWDDPTPSRYIFRSCPYALWAGLILLELSRFFRFDEISSLFETLMLKGKRTVYQLLTVLMRLPFDRLHGENYRRGKTECLRKGWLTLYLVTVHERLSSPETFPALLHLDLESWMGDPSSCHTSFYISFFLIVWQNF